jgi:hypothetical protein
VQRCKIAYIYKKSIIFIVQKYFNLFILNNIYYLKLRTFIKLYFTVKLIFIKITVKNIIKIYRFNKEILLKIAYNFLYSKSYNLSYNEKKQF